MNYHTAFIFRRCVSQRASEDGKQDADGENPAENEAPDESAEEKGNGRGGLKNMFSPVIPACDVAVACLTRPFPC